MNASGDAARPVENPNLTSLRRDLAEGRLTPSDLLRETNSVLSPDQAARLLAVLLCPEGRG